VKMREMYCVKEYKGDQNGLGVDGSSFGLHIDLLAWRSSSIMDPNRIDLFSI